MKPENPLYSHLKMLITPRVTPCLMPPIRHAWRHTSVSVALCDKTHKGTSNVEGDSLPRRQHLSSWPFIDEKHKLWTKNQLTMTDSLSLPLSLSPSLSPGTKVHGANMGPISGRQDPGGPHVGPMNLLSGSLSLYIYHIYRLSREIFNELLHIKFVSIPAYFTSINLDFTLSFSTLKYQTKNTLHTKDNAHALSCSAVVKLFIPHLFQGYFDGSGKLYGDYVWRVWLNDWHLFKYNQRRIKQNNMYIVSWVLCTFRPRNRTNKVLQLHSIRTLKCLV